MLGGSRRLRSRSLRGCFDVSMSRINESTPDDKPLDGSVLRGARIGRVLLLTRSLSSRCFVHRTNTWNGQAGYTIEELENGEYHVVRRTKSPRKDA